MEICGLAGSVLKQNYLIREQYYLDLYKPSLNLNPNADSSFEFKHTEESKKLIAEYNKNKTVSESTRQRLSELFSKELNPFWGKTHTS